VAKTGPSGARNHNFEQRSTIFQTVQLNSIPHRVAQRQVQHFWKLLHPPQATSAAAAFPPTALFVQCQRNEASLASIQKMHFCIRTVVVVFFCVWFHSLSLVLLACDLSASCANVGPTQTRTGADSLGCD